MQTEVNFELMGKQAKIQSIIGKVDRNTRNEIFIVSINIPDGLDGLLGFSVEVPVKKYSPKELLKVIVKATQPIVMEHIERRAREAREKELNEQGNKLLTSMVVDL